MGSSSMDSMATGDIEAQKHNPKWFVDHKHMLHPNQEGEANKLGCSILKVPKYMRQPPEAFSPMGWRFGLHNRENLDSSGSEAVKLGIAVQWGLVGKKWDHFCEAIVDDPKAMLACYDLQNGVMNWTDEHIKHVLALDALFLATYIIGGIPGHGRQLMDLNKLPTNSAFYARYQSWIFCVRRDLFRVENQIPFILIGKVVKYLNIFPTAQISEGNAPFISDLQYQQKIVEVAVCELAGCFMATSSEAFKTDNLSQLVESTHILGAAYKVICGSEGLLMKREHTYIHAPSATRLKQSGIQIVGIDGPLCRMSYEKKCLYLPKLRIYDDTFSFIRNMEWYELQSAAGNCLFHDYIHFMSDLIQTAEDLDLLVQYGVIYNACGTKANGMWTSLEEGGALLPSSQTHHDMKKAIMSRCHRRRYKLRSEFNSIFCSKPWFVLSTIAVVLVTMATLIQTYISIIGSNKMKPKFP